MASAYRRVVAFDPGVSTGVAYRHEDGTIITTVIRMPEGVDDEPTEVYDLITSGVEHVVYERYHAETISKYGLYTVELVGSIKALCYAHGIPKTGHMPQDRRPFMEDAKKLLAGVRHVIHERDALGHLLRWEYDQQQQNNT